MWKQTNETFRQTGVNDNNNNDNINNNKENDDYDCNHKIAKQEQRNRENTFDGLRSLVINTVSNLNKL